MNIQALDCPTSFDDHKLIPIFFYLARFPPWAVTKDLSRTAPRPCSRRDHKRLLHIANSSAVKPNIGHYVEIQGSLDADFKTLHVDSLKLLEKGVAKSYGRAPIWCT